MSQVHEVRQEIQELQALPGSGVSEVLWVGKEPKDNVECLDHPGLQVKLFRDHRDLRDHRDRLDHWAITAIRVYPVKEVI